jgi:hypothetical protein
MKPLVNQDDRAKPRIEVEPARKDRPTHRDARAAAACPGVNAPLLANGGSIPVEKSKRRERGARIHTSICEILLERAAGRIAKVRQYGATAALIELGDGQIVGTQKGGLFERIELFAGALFERAAAAAEVGCQPGVRRLDRQDQNEEQLETPDRSKPAGRRGGLPTSHISGYARRVDRSRCSSPKNLGPSRISSRFPRRCAATPGKTPR